MGPWSKWWTGTVFDLCHIHVLGVYHHFLFISFCFVVHRCAMNIEQTMILISFFLFKTVTYILTFIYADTYYTIDFYHTFSLLQSKDSKHKYRNLVSYNEVRVKNHY